MKKVLFLAIPVLLFLSCTKTDVSPITYFPVSYPSSITADFIAIMEEPNGAVMDGNTELKVGDNVTIKVMVQVQNDFIISGEIAFLNADEIGNPEIERMTVPVTRHDLSEYSIDCYNNTCDDWITINFIIPQSLESKTIGMTLSLYGSSSNATTTLTPAFKVVVQ